MAEQNTPEINAKIVSLSRSNSSTRSFSYKRNTKISEGENIFKNMPDDSLDMILFFDEQTNQNIDILKEDQCLEDNDICFFNEYYSVVSIQGNKKQMQDRNFFAVLDGHGNEKVVEYLQNHLYQNIKMNPMFEQNIQESIKQSFQQIDQVFQNDKQFDKSGCVCIICMFQNGKMYIVNLGDCRANLYNNQGQYFQLSSDHTPENREDEVNRIMNNKGNLFLVRNELRVNGELNVTRAFGDSQYKQYIISEPEIFVYEMDFVKQYQFLVLGSDGFWNNENAQESIKICKTGNYADFPVKQANYIYETNQCFRDDTTILSINLNNIY